MLIILDRDGVINHESVDYIKTPEEWLPYEGSLSAIARLNKAGHTVVVATNQAGVGRGYYSLTGLNRIHQKMRAELAKVGGKIEKIYFCPHHPSDNCLCRKPKPGLLLQIAQDFPDLFPSAIFVGDSLRDIEAAQAVNCKVALVRTGNGHETLRANLQNIPVFNDLSDFVSQLLTESCFT